MRTSKIYLFRAGYNKVVSHLLGLAETQKQADQWENSMQKKGRLQVVPAWVEVVSMEKLQVG